MNSAPASVLPAGYSAHVAAAVAAAISSCRPCPSLVARMLMMARSACWVMKNGNRLSMRVEEAGRCKPAGRGSIAVGLGGRRHGLGGVGSPARLCYMCCVVGMGCPVHESSPRRTRLVAKVLEWSTWGPCVSAYVPGFPSPCLRHALLALFSKWHSPSLAFLGVHHRSPASC